MKFVYVFILPFAPAKIFSTLKSNSRQSVAAIVSIVATLGVLLIDYYFTAYKILSPTTGMVVFSLGFLFKVFIYVVISAVLFSRLNQRSLQLKQSFVVVGLSSLPLSAGALCRILFDQAYPFVWYLGTLYFAVLMAVGFKVYFEIKWKKAIAVAIGIVFFMKFLEVSIFGVPAI